ncbi:MAG TPA: 3'-5' exonuclease [Polyangiales bacterium]|jgi:DNA polymerase-3 subunit epsilon
MRGALDVCGCFPTGRHYPGIADRLLRALRDVAGLSSEFEARTRWAETRLAIIDFETTGLSPENDRVLEIGVACFSAGQLTLLKNWLINPGIPIPEEARAVHNISDEELKDAPSFNEVARELSDVLRGHIPVAYNAAFDRAFLHAELKRLGAFESWDDLPPAFLETVHWIDPLVWVRELYSDDKSRKLADITARLGIALERAHRAASDAEAAGRVLLALAERLPTTYAEVINLQANYAARQDLDFKSNRRR